jgi:anti-anti-sigma regulatory factor
MPPDLCFTIEQYDRVAVLTWTKTAVTRELHNREMRAQIQAFVLTTRPEFVVVNFAQLACCTSSLLRGLMILAKQLDLQGGRLILCEMSQQLRKQFDQLHISSRFEIQQSLSDATTACLELAKK